MKLVKNKYSFLGIIPARAGSKGIKNKNIVRINNKPLIYYTIKAAKQSNLLNDIVVSTDSKKIAQICNKYGVNTPFLRPKNISTDKSNIIHTLRHALKKTEILKKKKYDYIVLLQPTSPKREKNEIDNCIRKILKKKSDSLISLCNLSHPHPVKLKKIIKNKIYPYQKYTDNPPRQLLEKLYMPSGNVYITERNLLLKGKITSSKTTFTLINQKNYLNIDDTDDLIIAKAKLK